MPKTQTIEGREYVTATYAGRHFGYTKDYLLLLIKNGKIDGRKIGNKWFVHLPSAEVFFTLAKKQQEERRKKLSLDRKRELKEHTQIDFFEGKQMALIQTLVMLVLGLSIGVTSFLGTSPLIATSMKGEYGPLERVAVSLYNFVHQRSEHTVREVLPEGVSQEASIIGGSTPTSSLIVAPAHAFTEENISAVRDSFSDEVNIEPDPENPDTGLVTPVFKNSEDETCRFLMVPVRKNESS